MNVRNVLMCPECKCSLDNNLECTYCHRTYELKNNVYDIISPNISKSQLERILWKYTDDMLNDDRKIEQIKMEWEKLSYSFKNEQTLEAEKIHNEYMSELINTFSGNVCDLATGRGTLLQTMINSKNINFHIFCTDISKQILAVTRKVRQTEDDRISYVATDGRHMSFKDKSFDYITSYAGFGNIPDTEQVAKELLRILKNHGKIIIKGNYIEKGSKSYELAKSHNIERGLVEEYLINDLENAGFVNVSSIILATAMWNKNPYNLLPVAGDTIRYCIIQAEKQ